MFLAFANMGQGGFFVCTLLLAGVVSFAETLSVVMASSHRYGSCLTLLFLFSFCLSTAGSTACVAIFFGPDEEGALKLITAHAGDSRAVLCRCACLYAQLVCCSLSCCSAWKLAVQVYVLA